MTYKKRPKSDIFVLNWIDNYVYKRANSPGASVYKNPLIATSYNLMRDVIVGEPIIKKKRRKKHGRRKKMQ